MALSQHLDNAIEKGKTFRISSAIKKERKGAPDIKSKSADNSNSWDKILNDYEKFADEYIKLLKKAQAGDMSALSEYPSVLEKAESLSNQLASAGSDLTSKQLAKFTKIQTKIANAAMGE
jgi:hypothetical protein